MVQLRKHVAMSDRNDCMQACGARKMSVNARPCWSIRYAHACVMAPCVGAAARRALQCMLAYAKRIQLSFHPGRCITTSSKQVERIQDNNIGNHVYAGMHLHLPTHPCTHVVMWSHERTCIPLSAHAPTEASHANNRGLLRRSNGGAHHAATSAARPNGSPRQNRVEQKHEQQSA